MKMPIIVGIFIFISRGNFMLSWVEHERSFITLDSGLIYGFKAQKNIISLGPEPLQQPTANCHLLIAKGFGGPTGLVACAYLNDHVRIVIMPNVSAIAATWIHLSHNTRSRTHRWLLVGFLGKSFFVWTRQPSRLLKHIFVQNTSRHRSVRYVFPAFPFKDRKRIAVLYSNSDEHQPFVSEAMFIMFYLINE